MRSRSASPVGTLLTIVAVLAVPLLAIFGIPQFMPVVASPSLTSQRRTDAPPLAAPASAPPLSARDIFAPVENPVAPAVEGMPVPADAVASSRGAAVGSAPQPVWPKGWSHPAGSAPAFRAAPGARAASPAAPPPLAPRQDVTAAVSGARRSHHAEVASAAVSRPQTDPLAGPPAFDPRSQAAPRPASAPTSRPDAHRIDEFSPQTARPATSAEALVDSASAPTAAILTWRQAIQQLNALGIRQYRLQPGHRIDTFHFCCYVYPTGDPRVAVRFESEADDPLQAVRQVLAQVTEWYRNQ